MRTPLTYYGGKQRLAERLVAEMPPHYAYLEAFAGGLAVLFEKPRAQRETINDLDGAVAAFWEAVRDEPEEFARVVAATPYSRSEWQRCGRNGGCDEDGLGTVERARRLLVKIEQSFARSGTSWSPPSLLADRRGRWQAGTWLNLPERIRLAAGRLEGVALESTDALELLPRFDQAATLIYCDPPYEGEHRREAVWHGYRYDTTPELWGELAEALLAIDTAAVMLSGYPCEATALLEESGWRRVRLDQRRMSAAKLSGDELAPESVWLNPSCQAAQLSLLGG